MLPVYILCFNILRFYIKIYQQNFSCNYDSNCISMEISVNSFNSRTWLVQVCLLFVISRNNSAIEHNFFCKICGTRFRKNQYFGFIDIVFHSRLVIELAHFVRSLFPYFLGSTDSIRRGRKSLVHQHTVFHQFSQYQKSVW